MKKIVFTGGGTGGHVFPIVAIVREIIKMNPQKFEFFYIGPKDPFGAMLLSQEGIKLKTIYSGKIRRYLKIEAIFQNIIDILIRIPIGFFQAFYHIFCISPDLIFSKGGYGSVPVIISGWILQTPIFLHESDVIPGLANRISNRFAIKVFVSFPRTKYFSVKKRTVVGNPIRKGILEGSKSEAIEKFNLTKERPVILVLGGSQGAQRINDFFLQILPEILKKFELIHQCGEKNFTQVKSEAQVTVAKDLMKYYHLFPFLKEGDLKHAYQAADLIIGRAGSGTIFEIAAIGKPSILIPLPEAAQRHQSRNAYELAEDKATLIIEEENLTPHLFLQKLNFLFDHPQYLESLAKNIEKFSKPDAAQVIAEYLVEYLTR